MSDNWSGYALQGGPYRAITGSWTVPAVAASASDTYSATWVGIDGRTNNDLIQTGTEQNSVSGHTTYYAWWEILPAVETFLPSIAVHPGDTMSASIAQTRGNTWRISITDRSDGQSFQTSQQYFGPTDSADWIQEAPTVGGQISTLASYSRTGFLNGTVDTFAPQLSDPASIVMEQNSQQVSTPSAPDAAQSGFNVAYGAQPPAPPAQPGDRTFVRTPDGAIYMIAGGAPVYVSSCAPLGGCPGLTAVPNLSEFHTHPLNGTFIAGAQRGEVYRIAGGAPIYVSTWSAFGGAQPTVTVDQYAIDNAGRGGVLDHMRDRPAAGTFIAGAQRGEVYRIAGGAPIYVSNWGVFGGPKPTVVVDQVAIDHASAGAAAWSHLRYYPAAGTFLQQAGLSGIFRVAGHAALPIFSCTHLARCPHRAVVDGFAIDNAGAPGAWHHLALHPVNGTILKAAGARNAWLIRHDRRYRTTHTRGAIRVNRRTIRLFPLG